MDAVFAEALDCARQRFGDEEWNMLDVKRQTAAIYEEMKRIDSETSKLRTGVAALSGATA